ncbi:hypothetical protein VTO73DRAFT_8836 [Trametes versicolor]
MLPHSTDLASAARGKKFTQSDGNSVKAFRASSTLAEYLPPPSTMLPGTRNGARRVHTTMAPVYHTQVCNIISQASSRLSRVPDRPLTPQSWHQLSISLANLHRL